MSCHVQDNTSDLLSDFRISERVTSPAGCG
jgi:hypothetical protein